MGGGSLSLCMQGWLAVLIPSSKKKNSVNQGAKKKQAMFENLKKKKKSIENNRANILFHSTNLPYIHILNYVCTFGLLRN